MTDPLHGPYAPQDPFEDGMATAEVVGVVVGMWTAIPGTGIEIGLYRHDEVPFMKWGRPWPVRWRYSSPPTALDQPSDYEPADPPAAPSSTDDGDPGAP